MKKRGQSAYRKGVATHTPTGARRRLSNEDREKRLVLSHLVTHHADRQHPVDEGDRDHHQVADQPLVLPELIPTDQVTLGGKDGHVYPS